MKRFWKSVVATMLAGSAALAGCATPAASQSSGLTVQQLTNVVEPRSGSSWLPKISMPKWGENSRKESASYSSMEVDRAQPPRKSNKPGDTVAMARLYEMRGQTEAAAKLYEQELTRDPKQGLVHHRLAVISSKNNNWAKARLHFDTALELMPGNSELLNDLGYALYLQHQLPDAEAALTAAVQANPKNLSAHNNLGIVLGVQGRFDESLVEFRRAGGDAEAYANLAYVHTQLGDVEQAMANLHKALAHDPKLRQAASALVQLNELKRRVKPALEATAEPGAMLAKREPAAQPAEQGEAAFEPGESALPELAPIVAAREGKTPTPSLAKLPQRPIDRLAAATVQPAVRVELPGPQESPSQSLAAANPAPVVSPAEARAPAKIASAGMPARQETLQRPATPQPRPLASSVAQSIRAPQLLTPSGPAPVISPSKAMQELREQERVAMLPENKPLVNPYLKSRSPVGVADPAAPGANGPSMDELEMAVAPALFATGDSTAEMNGVMQSEFNQALKPVSKEPVAGPTSGTPLFAPRAQLPGPMDQLPPEALVLQMPTSRLHPNAQPTWSGQDRPAAGAAQQPTMKSAHYFDWTGKVNP